MNLQERIEVRGAAGKMHANLEAAVSFGLLDRMSQVRTEQLALFLAEKGWRKS